MGPGRPLSQPKQDEKILLTFHNFNQYVSEI
jgi:hypothetical protein